MRCNWPCSATATDSTLSPASKAPRQAIPTPTGFCVNHPSSWSSAVSTLRSIAQTAESPLVKGLAGFALISFFVVRLMIRETKGRELEDMEELTV